MKSRPTFSRDETNDMYRCQSGSREFLFSRIPYDSQVELIESMRDTMESGRLGFFESPTGTGKTLSTITSVYSWLLDVYNEKISMPFNKDLHEESSSKNVPSFVQAWNRKNARSKLEEEINQTRKFNRRKLGEQKSGDTDNETSTNPISYSVPKVIFLSRTHSQLHQFVRELKSTPYHIQAHHPHGSVFLLSLASRKHTCLNKTVKAKCKGDGDKLNEMCLELGTSCEYRNRQRINTLADSLAKTCIGGKPDPSGRALALSDIEALGETNTCCPYYASRAALPAADVIVAPYSLLLDEGALSESGIELEGSVVIFDEAHNVIPACHDSLSVQVSADLLNILNKNVFSPTASAKSFAQTKVHLYSLQTICTRMLNFLDLGTQECVGAQILPENFPKNKRLFSVSSFLGLCDISSYNLFSLTDFILNSASKAKHCQAYKKHLSSFRKFLLNLASDENDSVIVLDTESMSLKIVGLCAKRVFYPILSRALAVIMLSGTLQPREVLEAELLPGSIEDSHADGKRIVAATFPHVVPDSQIYVSCWPESFSGTRFRFSYSKIRAEKGMAFKDTMISGLSQILLNLCNVVKGGIVLFFTSHDYLKHVCEVLQENKIVEGIHSRGKKLFAEVKNAEVSDILGSYCREIEKGTGSGAVLLAVMGGRLSEGINFADNHGRVLCVVGLPYANPFDVESYARLKYIKEGPINGKANVRAKESSRAYEDALCMTIVNQTIGRVIRHKGDYAAILFLDERMMNSSLQQMCSPWVQRNFRQRLNKEANKSTLDDFFQLRGFLKDNECKVTTRPG